MPHKYNERLSDEENESLSRRKKEYEDFLEWSDDYRDAAVMRRDYRNGIQWTSQEASTLNARGEPVLTFNLLGGKIGAMLGAEIVGRTDPKAIGRNPGRDELGASVCTAAIRYVCDAADWNEERTLCRENYYVEGTQAAEVVVERAERDGEGFGNPEIFINHIPWDRVFHDPYSRHKDFRDTNYLGYANYEYEEDLLEEFDGDEKAIAAILDSTMESTTQATASDSSHDDRPNDWVSIQGGKRRLRRVVEWYKEAGDWWYCEYIGGGYLDGPRISPYVDRKGKTQPGLLARSCYVRKGNERVGIAQDLMSPQDEVNKRRSKALHLMNTKTIIATPGAVEDPEIAKQEIHKASGYIEKAPGAEFAILDHQQQVVDNLQLMQEAKSQFETIGPSEALMGSASPDASGRSIELRQRSALLKYGDVLDGARAFELAVYRQVWHRITQYWTEEQYVRVTDDPVAAQYLGINMRQPVTMAETLMERGWDQRQLQAAVQSGELSPHELQQVVGEKIVNNPAELDVDIILDTGPDLRVMREQQLENLMSLIGQVGQQLKPEVLDMVLEMIIELSPLDGRIKQRFLQTIRPTEEQQQAQAQQQAEQQMIQRQAVMLELQKKAADVEKTNADTELSLAKAETEGAKAGKEVASAASTAQQMFMDVQGTPE